MHTALLQQAPPTHCCPAHPLLPHPPTAAPPTHCCPTHPLLAPPTYVRTLTAGVGPLGSSVVTTAGKLAAPVLLERRTFSKYCFSSAMALFHSFILEPARLGGVGSTPVNC